MLVLTTFKDKTQLVFKEGRFDKYLVTLIDNNGNSFSPKDVDFLNFFQTYSDRQDLWELLLELSQFLDKDTAFSDLVIPSIKDTIEEKKMFAAYAATLIAEENRAKTKLGKRIKLIAAHQVLIQGWQPQKAADWSRGLRWATISQECDRYGF